VTDGSVVVLLSDTRRAPMAALDNLAMGAFGVWTSDYEFQPASQVRESVQELEALGWRTVWVPESRGREAMTHAGFLLASTEAMHVVNGIAQIWAREAKWTYGASVLLADAYPNRHVLGLGFGGSRPGVGSPMTSMVEYLDQLDAMETPNPAPRAPMRRLLAAYGPKMLELARDRSDGAHVYHVNLAHTAQSREILGADAFLGVEHPIIIEADPEKARAIARDHLHRFLSQKYNIAKFRRLGYTEDDMSNGGSNRIVDDLVFWGGLEVVVEKLRGHLDAGADHVGIQVLGIRPGKSAMPQWRELATALLP
jgi:probable F420-dependent oxidoreductase